MEQLQASIATVLVDSQAWIVGGVIRDELLGRETTDVDVALVGDASLAAKKLARELNAFSFSLSDQFGTWRVADRAGGWQIDLTHIRGDSIESDLKLRDFTINAMARPVGGDAIIDLFGGRSDLESGCLRAVSDNVFLDDPLRSLRLVRSACELNFTYDDKTASLARKSSNELTRISGERIAAELKRVIASDRAVEGVRMLNDLGLLAEVLPEIANLKDVEQSEYHHLDVFEHSLAVLLAVMELESDPEPLGKAGREAVERLNEPLSDDLTRWQALRLAALFHDCGKSQTREVDADGNVTFHGHDEAGAKLAKEAMKRLRVSQKLTNYVADIARHHLALTFRLPECPSDRDFYVFLRTTEPVEVDVVVIAVADRVATQGKNYEKATEEQLVLAADVLPRALAWADRERAVQIKGDELASELDLEEGPVLGQLLREVDAAQYAGEVTTRDELLTHARRWLES